MNIFYNMFVKLNTCDDFGNLHQIVLNADKVHSIVQSEDINNTSKILMNDKKSFDVIESYDAILNLIS